MSFLPDNYQAPKSNSSYFRFQEGENRIRILSKPILGWEDWLDNKPIRFPMEKKPLAPINDKKPIKHFWAFIVFNYKTEKIEIMQITQATIRKSLETLSKDADWGAPYNYDIKIFKKGENVDTEYSVNPIPHKVVDPYIIEQFNEYRCYLPALFTNDDPFSSNLVKYTEIEISNPSVFEKEEVQKPTTEQLEHINLMFNECDAEYKKSLLFTLSQFNPPVKSLNDIPLNYYDRILTAIMKKREEFINDKLLGGASSNTPF